MASDVSRSLICFLFVSLGCGNCVQVPVAPHVAKGKRMFKGCGG